MCAHARRWTAINNIEVDEEDRSLVDESANLFLRLE